MENDVKLFEEILEKCAEKKIQSAAKKMIKKPKITSQSTANNLCDLTYWLYIYGYEEETLAVCAYAHLPLPEPGKVDYRIWDFLLFIWGLEAYIYKKREEEEKSNARVEEMKKVWRTPNKMEQSEEEAEARRKKIEDRLTYEDAIMKAKMERLLESSPKDAKDWAQISLLQMIAYGVTGLFPHLESHKEELEEKIRQYISIAQGK